MMTFFKTCVVGLVAGLAMAGCAEQEDGAADALPLTSDVDVSQTPPAEMVQIPPELMLSVEKGDDVGTQACSRLIYCRDPRYTPHLPSYCNNGCTAQQALNSAYQLCLNNCGNIDCSVLYRLGPC